MTSFFIDEGHTEQSFQGLKAENATTELLPPKPKEFEMAAENSLNKRI